MPPAGRRYRPAPVVRGRPPTRLVEPMEGHHRLAGTAAAAPRGPQRPAARITDLGLHCAVDPDLGHDVLIAIRAETAALR
jgi:hypothetical protein